MAWEAARSSLPAASPSRPTGRAWALLAQAAATVRRTRTSRAPLQTVFRTRDPVGRQGMTTILITGAGSGLNNGAALELAQRGYDVIAGVENYPQVRAL